MISRCCCTPPDTRLTLTTAPRARKRPAAAAMAAVAPAELSALVQQPSAGDELVVPCSVWPTHACGELDGAGWVVTVVGATRKTAEVRFAHATTRDGRRYENVRLPLAALRTRSE